MATAVAEHLVDSLIKSGANVAVYKDLVPKVVETAPGAVIVVVTDPPDPLADVARRLAGHDRVLSTGTLLDNLRFRVHLAQRLGVSAASVDAPGHRRTRHFGDTAVGPVERATPASACTSTPTAPEAPMGTSIWAVGSAGRPNT
jgi:hypothetical protein